MVVDVVVVVGIAVPDERQEAESLYIMTLSSIFSNAYDIDKLSMTMMLLTMRC